MGGGVVRPATSQLEAPTPILNPEWQDPVCVYFGFVPQSSHADRLTGDSKLPVSVNS